MDFIINQKEYKLFCQKINALLQKYCPEKSAENIYYINTPCGKLKVVIDEYNRYTQWIFTKIECPDKVMYSIKRKQNFNIHSGKYNNCDNDLHYLISWLYCYIEDLINPQDNMETRNPLLEMLHDKEGKFVL